MKYNIKLVSFTNSIVTIISLFAIFFSTFGLIIPKGGVHSTPLIILYLIVIFAIVYFVWQKFVTGRTLWTINDTGITMEWIKQFALTKQAGINLKWSEISGCVERSDGGLNYRVFKIKLISGYNYSFYHSTSFSSDEYDGFQSELRKYLADKKIPFK